MRFLEDWMYAQCSAPCLAWLRAQSYQLWKNMVDKMAAISPWIKPRVWLWMVGPSWYGPCSFSSHLWPLALCSLHFSCVLAVVCVSTRAFAFIVLSACLDPGLSLKAIWFETFPDVPIKMSPPFKKVSKITPWSSHLSPFLALLASYHLPWIGIYLSIWLFISIPLHQGKAPQDFILPITESLTVTSR